MPIVSDTSPLILLAKTGRLDLLRELFGEVAIPVEVNRELAPTDRLRPEAATIHAASWIRISSVESAATSLQIADRLGPGEAAVIRLAHGISPRPVVLLDDLAARRTAEQLDLRLTGTGGVIVLAKQAGLIAEARPLLKDLQIAGLYLANAVMASLFAAAGEPSGLSEHWPGE